MRRLNTSLIPGLVFLLASTVRAQTPSGANNSELNGTYAFAFNGFTSADTFAFVGSFTADGAGNLTNGELDSNAVSGGPVLTAQPFTGTYAIGSDNRGMMTLNVRGSAPTFAFVMTAGGNARFIWFSAAGGSGTIGSGTMEKVTTTAFNTTSITGDYAFGLVGFDPTNRRVGFVGRLTADGAGNFSNGAGDINAGGSMGSATFTTATYTFSDTTTGRGTISLGITFGGTPYTLSFVFYTVNSAKLLAMETDAVTGSTPLLNGEVLQQQTPAGGFSNASLNGGMVLSLTGLGIVGNGTTPSSKAIVGLLTGNGLGTYNLSYDENWGGVLTSTTGATGPYTVAANGRATIVFGTNTEIAYLLRPNQSFFLTADVTVLFGHCDAQAAGTFTNSSVMGNYAGWTITPAKPSVTVFSGEFSADGASPSGNLTGTVDVSNAGGSAEGQAFAASYTVSTSPTNGRGSFTITSGSGGSAIAYVVSPSKFAMIPLNDPNPAVWFFEQGASAPPPPPVSLSSLTLNPTSVIGGTQSSTGTVTLSGPAPSGGAQIVLSSSNTTVAQVPANVTVAAGATSATFTVTTSAVAASTSVTISASYGGVTRTASLTVTPATPPPVTLTSLTLNPTAAVGGTQSSTGTVTLSGPAPSGGARVALSSSNAAAQVPSSVTVPAGATSASFTVTTSLVLSSTNVTITASYNGTSAQANLAVNAVLSLGGLF